MEFVTITDVTDAPGWDEVTDADWPRIEGLVRRAQRELTLLVGDLGPHDAALVRDTLLDAIREEWSNPNRLVSESDDNYSYRRHTLPSGAPGRFWWPVNLLDLFGVESAGGRLRSIPVGLSPASRGWL